MLTLSTNIQSYPFCCSSFFYHSVNAFTPVVHFIIISYILLYFITWVLLYRNVRTAFVSIVLLFQNLTLFIAIVWCVSGVNLTFILFLSQL